MAKIPINKGIDSDSGADYRTSYPLNYYPVEKKIGSNAGYLYPTPGIRDLGEIAPSSERFKSRGGEFNSRMNKQFRVIGPNLYEIKSETEFIDLGAIPGTARVAMTHSFNSQVIVTNTRAYRYDGTTLARITDQDLGVVFDGVWLDGAYIFTDGENLIATDLDNEESIDPLRYGSSEVFPDGIVGLGDVQNELVAFNRFSIEVFSNAAVEGFPFVRVPSAMIRIGLVGTHAKVTYGGGYAFLGGGKNENISIWYYDGRIRKIASREIEIIIAQFSEGDLSRSSMDSYSDGVNNFLVINMPDKEQWVYDLATSSILGVAVWHERSPDNAQHPVHNKGVWWVANNEGHVGIYDHTLGTEWGDDVERRFDCMPLWMDTDEAILHRLELQGTFGRGPNIDSDPVIHVSWTDDGEIYSNQRSLHTGKKGKRTLRFTQRRLGKTRQYRSYRFRSFNASRISISRLDMTLEALSSDG